MNIENIKSLRVCVWNRKIIENVQKYADNENPSNTSISIEIIFN